MGAPVHSNLPAPEHSSAFRTRRFLNWFPLGVAYALLYMGRYNLTVAKASLSSTSLMTNEDFGVIFGVGTFVYAFSFLLNGPLIDRIGGRKGMLAAVSGALVANVAMGAYLHYVLTSGAGADAPLRLVFSLLYAVNMYFQSFGAVSIVKVNAHWFHVSERGGFSGIFGTMISSGLFLAFSVNFAILDLAQGFWKGQPVQWVVFAAPALLLATILAVEFFLLRDRPGQAGHQDFDTGDASSGDTSEAPVPTLELFKRLLTHPVLLTVAFIEFCTGVLRNGVMHWFPIYAKEVWVLPKTHALVGGDWNWLWLGVGVAIASISFVMSRRAIGATRAYLVIFGGLAFMTPFLVRGGWGGLLMVAGIIGGNVAGWVSDLFFQSRRGPAAAGLYGFLALCTVGMVFALAKPSSMIEQAAPETGLLPGDRIVSIEGKAVEGWADVRKIVACVPAECEGSAWDAEACTCSTKALAAGAPKIARETRVMAAEVERAGAVVAVEIPDLPNPKKPEQLMRAGDKRSLKAQPVLPFSPYWMGVLVFLVSLCVIGTHGLLSGTATMDFGGRKAAGTAVGMIDGFVYLGTALQSVSLGFLTSKSWGYWPPFLIPFAVVGFLLCLKIWNAKPKAKSAAH